MKEKREALRQERKKHRRGRGAMEKRKIRAKESGDTGSRAVD